MEKRTASVATKGEIGRLTRERAEKISAVEGLSLSPRMKRLFEISADKTADERRALVREQFAKKSA
ncbi:hypothetical protein [Pararhizobium antarcticum]|uniref:Uncharacterized protein n=1 Tax=Pararhizobium antarcticum TaxID=1798805 RepID=A0A657LNP4_9HYPH|nr:hypothetical protein [Pararhizobium antarcticum]OJF91494.1 hypothetical protein AX760_23335 [Pararhizobium antarcticum]OJF99486.1 hypothetical protein AX761_10910 [Rhizobium sp. 58]